MAASVDTLNSQLSHIYQLLEKDSTLKGQLEFTVHRKSAVSGSKPAKTDGLWKQVYRLTGSDLATICLLQAPDRGEWVNHPERFVSILYGVVSIFDHPILQLAWQYVVLQQVDARTSNFRAGIFQAQNASGQTWFT